jgi:hypothetical protein
MCSLAFLVKDNGKGHELWGHRLKEFGRGWAPPCNFWTQKITKNSHDTRMTWCMWCERWLISLPRKKGFVLPCIMKLSFRLTFSFIILCVRVNCLRVRSGPFSLPLSREKSNKKKTKWCSL